MLVLASSSPRRSDLLALAGFEFQVIPSVYDEGPLKAAGLPAEELVKGLARGKALEVSVRTPPPAGAPSPGPGACGSCADVEPPLVVGADTVVVSGDEVLGKPHDREDAKRMLRALSGETHRVLTGVCVARAGAVLDEFCEATQVTFYPLDERQIDSYVAGGEPMDKAGAYGIQGAGCLLVRGIRGDYFNVVGLPVARLARSLARLGVAPDFSSD